MFRERTTCRLCGLSQTDLDKGRTRPVLSLPPTPLANSFCKTREEAVALEKFPLDVFACSRCGHHQLGVVVDPSLMFSNYAYASGTSKSFVQHFNNYAREIVRRRAPIPESGPVTAPPSRFRVLEVGSNDGTMLKALLSTGFVTHVVGIEPATNLARKCREEGLNVIEAFFDESEFTIDVDFWTANNVLAHVDDFVGTLKTLALTNARGGVFEVQYLGALLDHGHIDNIYHEHLDYWRATELITELQVFTPWVVVDIELVPTHGGSLRVWVERCGRAAITGTTLDNALSNRAVDLLATERKRDWSAAWTTLRAKMAAERKRLHALLGDHQRIAVFGAPAKLTTLLYGLQLTNLNFAYVVDDSPLKQGLFTPGMGLEVCGVDHLRVDPPDAVLVGAWNFAEHIVPRVADLCPGKAIVTPFSK